MRGTVDTTGVGTHSTDGKNTVAHCAPSNTCNVTTLMRDLINRTSAAPRRLAVMLEFGDPPPRESGRIRRELVSSNASAGPLPRTDSTEKKRLADPASWIEQHPWIGPPLSRSVPFADATMSVLLCTRSLSLTHTVCADVTCSHQRDRRR